jgi:glycosyltransferase involved in cell wall biosynthesis
MTTWAIFTGEYPPDPGGVSDYTGRVATALAGAGEDVHVFAPGSAASSTNGGVTCHRLNRGFDARALRELSGAVAHLPSPRRILVQYVPHAFGYRSMNVPLCAWLSSLGDPVDVMFHEVAYPWSASPTALLAAAHRLMAAIVLRRADRVFVSTDAWAPLLRRLGARRSPLALAVPSTLPESVDAHAVDAIRSALGVEPYAAVLGHFGTYGGAVGRMLSTVIERLLRAPGRAAVLVGRGSDAFAAALGRAHPGVAKRILPTGPLPPASAALHLAVCDLLVQPYPDGITTRRTSAMAGLALGIPVVTNAGPLTEPVWLEEPALAVAPTASQLVDRAEALLSDSASRARAGAAGRTLYTGRFSLERTLAALLDGVHAGAEDRARSVR